MHANTGNSPALTLTVADLANLFHVSADRFRQMRPKLEAKGFPSRIPGAGARWSAPAVHHWIRSNAGTYAPLTDGAVPDAADPIASAQAQLEERYAA
ncbi:hypothetical protein [Kaistia sp. MMO-174]|uniref:hypothetical protein n=1 Tax=Kaistia sp. MMO-174 TaxID=3081256 RepID=UPI0030189F41